MIKKRYLEQAIVADLKEKMVFIGGPRQVGKSTLAQAIGAGYWPDYAYFNWDNRQHRQAMLREEFPAAAPLLIFDEIHKYKKWKQYLKGLYDVHHNRWRMLVTGSARLDLYRRGGDSLLGRYHYYRLHPFSVAEILERPAQLRVGAELTFAQSSTEAQAALQSLLMYGGFPEPFLKQNETSARRWRNERLDRLVREDIRDIETVRDLSALEILTTILPTKVGALFSLNSLREDLEVTHKTIALWTDILERFYYHFRLYPFAFTTIKSLRRQPKLYLWDWSEVPAGPARLENLVASHLLKFTHYLYDTIGERVELWFLRDQEGREVDFLVTINKKPWFAVEVKENELAPSPQLMYFNERIKIPWLYQVVGREGIDCLKNRVRVISASTFLSGLV